MTAAFEAFALERDGGDVAERLERDALIVLADRSFVLTPEEQPLLGGAPALSKSKSASYDPASGETRGAGEIAALAGPLMARYAAWAKALVEELVPAYASALTFGRTSFRWRDAADPPASARKDDRRLHADAFASQPTRGMRILRVFSNINPAGQARVWRIGEPFEAYASRFLPRARGPLPGEAWLLQRLGLTRAPRAPYDFLMLGLHDAAKLDAGYQATAPAREIALPAGSTWICFTDSAVHAAISGRWALEQTFYLPVSALARPELSPLRVLERLTRRALA
ncbi:MAG TPA: Kdo hydroxylase family protein [Caulobacteraceae bacterium]|nr:Kdo hydroxylase family protein [Caulobacteraceae bacterium]